MLFNVSETVLCLNLCPLLRFSPCEIISNLHLFFPVSSSSCASSSVPFCAEGFYPLCSAPIGCTAHYRYTDCLPAIGCLVSLTPSRMYCPCLCQTAYSFFPPCYLAGLLLLASVSLVIIFLLLSFIRTCHKRDGNIIFRCKFNASRLHACTGGHTISRHFFDTLS